VAAAAAGAAARAAASSAAATAAALQAPGAVGWVLSEGTTWTLWTEERLNRMLLAVEPASERTRAAYLRATATAVAFPEVDTGAPNWLSVRRAKELARLLLLARQHDAVCRAIDAMAVTGWAEAWDAWAIPAHVKAVMAATPRVDRDALLSLLLDMREAARRDFAVALERDFEAARAGGARGRGADAGDGDADAGAVGLDDEPAHELDALQVRDAVLRAFPGLLSPAQGLGVFAAGLGEDGGDGESGGWGRRRFMGAMLRVAANVLLHA
jgi:hypothetical protein